MFIFNGIPVIENQFDDADPKTGELHTGKYNPHTVEIVQAKTSGGDVIVFLGSHLFNFWYDISEPSALIARWTRKSDRENRQK